VSRFESRGGRRRGRRVILALGLGLVFAAIGTSLRVGARPAVTVEAALPGLGRSTPIRVSASSTGRGLSRLIVTLHQDDRSEVLLDKTYVYRPAWALWGPQTVDEVVEIEVGSETVEGLEDGVATLQVEASAPGTWVRRAPSTVVRQQYPVILRPPTLAVVSTQHYPAQGGAEVVVYTVGTTSIRDGVRSGDAWFPGYPLPGASDNRRFALFAVPFDLDSSESVRLEAEDALGNLTQTAFVDKFFPRPFRTDRIEVSEKFMALVVPEIQANTPGLKPGSGLVEDYVAINRDLRGANAQTLRDLAQQSRQEFLWSRNFQSLPNAQVMSAFADRRTYVFAGEEIDHQDHLGFDLASVKRAPVPAANDGLVILAGYFGIYGNTVLIDHGYALMSLYGHLSSFGVEPGQVVERGEIVGHTGETGLAAGDHLHFTMLLQGEAVNPVEWWDAKWLRDRLKRKLGEAMPFVE